jgi:hypothetical protein
MRLLKNTIKAIVIALVTGLALFNLVGIFDEKLMWIPISTIFVGGILLHTYPNAIEKFIEW